MLLTRIPRTRKEWEREAITILVHSHAETRKKKPGNSPRSMNATSTINMILYCKLILLHLVYSTFYPCDDDEQKL